MLIRRLAPPVAAVLLLLAACGEAPPHVSPFAPPDEPTASSALLVAVNSRGDNPFGRYLAEILRAEGLNAFRVVQVSDLDDDMLASVDAVLLAEGPLDAAGAQRLARYVENGGRLVAMRPDAALAGVLGVERAAGERADGYLAVADDPIGRGIAAGPLQYHGAADHYRLAGARAVARLADASGTASEFPAVTVHRHGRGEAALWAFDLARSVAHTRQGNPRWADQERDGLEGIRTADLFAGWIDLDRIAIPQADEQQRLLVNLLAALTADRRPLPRLWYFPGAAPAMLIATGDAHGSGRGAIEAVLDRVERRGGRMSVYYAPPPASAAGRAMRRARRWAASLPLAGAFVGDAVDVPSPSEAALWQIRGHEIALHPGSDLDADWRAFTALGYGPVPPTMRTHEVRWRGWVETARAQAAAGVRMNLDHYHVGPAVRRPGGERVPGYLGGSGLPMRFVDAEGRMLAVYQQPTALVDEELLHLPWSVGPDPGVEAAVEAARTQLRRAAAEAPAALAAQFHVDPFARPDDTSGRDAARWLDATLDDAAALGIPVWSAEQWLRFTEVRHDAQFEDVVWDPEAARLHFRLVMPAAADVELTVMVPAWKEETGLTQMSIDGEPVRVGVRRVGGVDYATATVGAGPHRVVAEYATAVLKGED